eukprot:2302657-Prymnesium_polylepis.1
MAMLRNVQILLKSLNEMARAMGTAKIAGLVAVAWRARMATREGPREQQPACHRPHERQCRHAVSIGKVSRPHPTKRPPQ